MIGLIDNGLLQNYISIYFGYGDVSAPIWFVGMEEGGPSDEASLAARLERWKSEGCNPLMNIRSHKRHNKFFNVSRPPTQATWRKLIRSILVAEGRTADLEAIRAYQRDELAAPGSSACLLELLPLPSRSIKDWCYSEYMAGEALKSREAYESLVRPQRIARLSVLVKEHNPVAVVFYGKANLTYWGQVAGVEGWTANPHFLSAHRGHTAFYCMNHPVRSGYEPYDALGVSLTAKLVDRASEQQKTSFQT